MSDPVPRDDGDLDYAQMVEQMGLDKGPFGPVFITDDTGEVKRVVRADPERGEVTLQDAYTNHRWTVGIVDLWHEWVDGDLKYRDRRFLRNDQRVVDVELLLEAQAIARSELEDMHQVDPEDDGSWTKRVRALVGELEGVIADED